LLGDNGATYDHLKAGIIGIQEYNMFGLPHVGSDVCGFLFETNEELCLRWHQLGAFHSFYRNHNDIKSPDQDPTQWPSVAKATQAANLFRYEHLPYLYT
jgi:alpha-glucosidase (family GH31 glycosyl hydrolase)